MADRADCPVTEAAATAVGQALRELTANLLRVTRGAGCPDLVIQQTLALCNVFDGYKAAAGRDMPPEQVAAALKLGEIPEDDDEEAWPDWDRAVRGMVHGAMQVAAAELMAQHAQAAAGRKELFSGYRSIEKLHARQLRRLLRR